MYENRAELSLHAFISLLVLRSRIYHAAVGVYGDFKSNRKKCFCLFLWCRYSAVQTVWETSHPAFDFSVLRERLRCAISERRIARTLFVRARVHVSQTYLNKEGEEKKRKKLIVNIQSGIRVCHNGMSRI